MTNKLRKFFKGLKIFNIFEKRLIQGNHFSVENFYNVFAEKKESV